MLKNVIFLTKKSPTDTMERIQSLFSILIFIVISIIISECYNRPYSDFDRDKSGLLYKIVKESESKEFSKTGDIVELKLIYKNINDSVLYNSEEVRNPSKCRKKKNHKLEEVSKMLCNC